jgi:hypothetical protein
MKSRNLIAWGTYVGVLAAIIYLIDHQLSGNAIFLAGGGTWIAFQAWAVYFLGGSTVRGGVKGFLGYVVGIALRVVIFELLSLFGPANWWAMPVAILLPVIPVMCLQEVEWLNYIPAFFIGCGAYFAILTYAAAVKPLAVSGTERWTAYLDAAVRSSANPTTQFG